MGLSCGRHRPRQLVGLLRLGWGWWFWDAVENASFMPWLLGTALIHSLAVTEKRGVFKSWTVLLAIGTFSLSLLGAFIVRSGVLTSVHAFAVDPERGMFILALLLLVVGGSLVLYAVRAPVMRADARYSGLSREVFLLVNNVLLVVSTAAVLLGTLYPLLYEALTDGDKISVGPPTSMRSTFHSRCCSLPWRSGRSRAGSALLPPCWERRSDWSRSRVWCSGFWCRSCSRERSICGR